MSESKHTPGPWRVDPAANCDIQTSDGSFEIATTHPGFLSRGKADPGRAQANARLIAAAPDLLAAMREQIAECSDPLCDMCARHERVIARATGAA